MKLTVGKGLNEYLRQLGNLSISAPETVKRAVYEGADIVADAIKTNIGKIPIDNRNGKPDRRTGLTSLQVAALNSSFGVAPMRNDAGYINVKAGFDGYNKVKTDRWPNGQPNNMIARSIESGTSYMQKHPFVAPAVRATKDRAELKMMEVVDREVTKVMK